MKNLIPFILLFSPFLTAQNLILNPSFEETNYYYFLPKTFTQSANDFEDAIVDWQIPNRTTPDLITPSFKDGHLIGRPRTGQNMVGLSIEKNWFEYIQIELENPLAKRKTYQVSFWVSRSKNKFNSSIKSFQPLNSNFGILFSSKIIEKESRVKPIDEQPQITCADNFEVSTIWREVSITFTASEAFKYLSIGEFFTIEKRSLSGTSGYILLDDVSIVEVKDFTTTELSLASGVIIPLRKVYFALGSSVIEEISYPELNKLVDFLVEKPDLKIQINGHTDNVGDKKLNRKLSEARAIEVQNFLIQNGISKERIRAKGFGDTMPIYENTSRENRGINRRVEFEVF